jgi:TolB-like protein/predicted Zn-dependent protease
MEMFLTTFLKELKRRNVFRVAIAYLALGWVVVQVTSLAVPALNLPESLNAIVFYLGMIGFPFSLLITWAFELTPEGIKRTHEVEAQESITHITGRKIDYAVIALLSLALLGVSYDAYLTPPDIIIESESLAEPSIAVLAFENISSDKDQDYFADGISEEILNLLAKNQSMKVAGRTSSFSFKDSKDDIPTIAKKLNVNHVLEGSVRKSGTTLRITAQLIRDDGYHVWSETYDRELTDIFKIQDEISAAILKELKVRLLGEEVTAEVKHDTENLDALQKYYMARDLIRKRTKESMLYALVVLKDALALDPNYTSAHAQMAIAYLLLYHGQYGDFTQAESLTFAGKSLRIAEALDDNNVDYLAAMGLYHLHTESLNKVVSYLKRALVIQPNHEEALRWQGNTLGRMGKMAEALALNEKLVEQNPLWVAALNNYADNLIALGEYEKHNEVIKQIEQLNPTSNFLISLRANIPQKKGELAQATITFLSDPLGTTTPFNKNIVLENFYSLDLLHLVPIYENPYLPYIYLAKNKEDEARSWAIKNSSNEKNVFNRLIAVEVYIQLNEVDNAYKLAEKIVEATPHLFLNTDARNVSCNLGLQVAFIYQKNKRLNDVRPVIDSCQTFLDNIDDSGVSPDVFPIPRLELALLNKEPKKALNILKNTAIKSNLLWPNYNLPRFKSLRELPEYPQVIAQLNEYKNKEQEKILAWLALHPNALNKFFK